MPGSIKLHLMDDLSYVRTVPGMPSTLLIAHDENVTPGWAALVLMSALSITEPEAVAVVMALHSQGWVDVTEYVKNPEKTAVKLAGLGLDVKVVEE